MTRKTYKITLDGKSLPSKFAWNSALRSMPNAIKSNLATDEANAALVFKNVTKRTQWEHTSGVFTWATNTGRTMVFAIELAA